MAKTYTEGEEVEFRAECTRGSPWRRGKYVGTLPAQPVTWHEVRTALDKFFVPAKRLRKVVSATAHLRGRGFDGCGAPIVDAAIYYVEDSRSVVGNCMSWWCPAGKGYTCELNEAGQFTGAEVLRMRTTDIPWLVEHIEARAVRHCRKDKLRG